MLTDISTARLATDSGQFGTNGVTLEVAPEIGLGVFGGAGLEASGKLLDCNKSKCET